MIMWLWWL